LGWALLTVAWIDVEHLLLPDALTLPLIIAGLVIGFFCGPEAFQARLWGALSGYVTFRGLAWTYHQLRDHDGLGGGDAKLAAAAGAWVGWQMLPSVVLLAALSGLAWVCCLALCGRRVGRLTILPFGPFLALATWIVWLMPMDQYPHIPLGG
jgi:leader peptidase (prepilin peptidase)/N-methyltransferase